MSAQAPGGEMVLRVENLVLEYPLPRQSLFAPAPRHRALDGVSLQVARGESLAVVGESGSGKSSLARAVLALEQPGAGRVELMGQDVFALSPGALRGLRRHAQMVFQDPYGSLDPRRKVGWIVAEPLDALESGVGAAARQARIAEVLVSVGLKARDAEKFPHEFSGGQRQRIAIARALITHPALIIADEPVSALDVSVQAQVLNLFMDLRERLGLSYLFISHDLAVVRHVADRVAVMRHGQIVEEGAVEQVFREPQHPYTRKLLAAVPRVGHPRQAVAGATTAP
ncbi:ABC transporter ATP-binding protein [Pelagibius litoralis]|uniref:ABC transporter ATP-binding protein n=1 Tax=Pelagibius litoralis TaxID=374515 RepID=A0A967C4B8_9PROT|nr:ATP-binding cassette domain-containing protein [Pelagibius litoralis]NIA68364.1 ABC transporter ATP-binding protein [Pelagibius litoralis]